MQNYKTMHAGSRSQATKLAEHLLSPTLPPGLALEIEKLSKEPTHGSASSMVRMRSDLDPRFIDLLGLTPQWSDRSGLTGLLSGCTAGGQPIAGLQSRRPSRSLSEAVHLQPDTLPTHEQLCELAAGRLADGSNVKGGERSSFENNRTKIYAAYGLPKAWMPDRDGLRFMAEGLAPDGTVRNKNKIIEKLNHNPSSRSALTLCFSASKPVSVLWAFTTGAARALIEDAHDEAVIKTMAAIERIMGHLRVGDGGSSIVPAQICYFMVRHYTSRPPGRSLDISAGDMQLHEHLVVLSPAIADDGRVGKLDFNVLKNRVKPLGALYQAEMSTALRRRGVVTDLDPVNHAVALPQMPLGLCEAFSKRTLLGVESARIFAASKGKDFDLMRPSQRRGLVKAGVQGDPLGARRDDIANPNAWRSQARGYEIPSVTLIDPERAYVLPARRERLRIAARVADDRLADAARRGTQLDSQTAATLGLLVAGLGDQSEIQDVMAAMTRAPLREFRFPAEVLSAASIAQKRSDGSALLVENDIGEHAAALWVAERSRREVVPPIQAYSHADAFRLAERVRATNREKGVIESDLVTIPIVRGGEVADLSLAVGDTIILGQIANGKGADGRNGRFGSRGSVATIVGLDEDGLDLVNDASRRARVRWRTLYSPQADAFMVDYGYAAKWPCRTGANAVAVMSEGSFRTTRLGVPDDARILFDAAVERRHLVESQGDGIDVCDQAVWRSIASNLTYRDRNLLVERCADGARRARTARLFGLLRLERNGGAKPGAWRMRGRRGTAIIEALQPLSDDERFGTLLDAEGLAEDHALVLGKTNNAYADREPAKAATSRPPPRSDAATIAPTDLLHGPSDEEAELHLGTTAPAQSLLQLRRIVGRLRKAGASKLLRGLVAVFEQMIEHVTKLSELSADGANLERPERAVGREHLASSREMPDPREENEATSHPEALAANVHTAQQMRFKARLRRRARSKALKPLLAAVASAADQNSTGLTSTHRSQQTRSAHGTAHRKPNPGVRRSGPEL